MTRDVFIERCQEAVDLSGDIFNRVIGTLIGHFMMATAPYESTGLPEIAEMPEGMAEMYIALMMLRLKYGITEEELEAAIEERLTKV